MDMKQCPHCGKQLPAEATLCPACMTELIERTSVSQPKQQAKWLLPTVGILLLLLVIFLLLLPKATAPDTADDPAQTNSTTPEDDTPLPEEPEAPAEYDNGTHHLEYILDGVTYQLTGHFSVFNQPYPPEEPVKTLTLPSDGNIGTVARLTVWNGTEYDNVLRQSFWDQVATVEVQVTDLTDEGILQVTDVWRNDEQEAPAYSAQLLIFKPGISQVCWVVTMKNGDILRLYTSVDAQAEQVAELSPTAQEAPDMASLQTYIDTHTADIPTETTVVLNLPAVTYEGTLDLGGHLFLVYGALDGPQRTTIKGSLNPGTEPSHFRNEIQNVDFIGSGGTAVAARRSVIFSFCSFTGYDVAIDWLDGAWVGLRNCTLIDNNAALQVNSTSYKYSESGYPNNVFQDNDIAIQFLTLRTDETLTFPATTFTGNGTDIDNPAGIALDTSGAVFE